MKPEARTAKVTSEQQSEHRTVTARKRKRVESGDSERTTSQRNDRAASQRSEKVADVVELCHVLPRDAGLEGERALQRVATQAGIWLSHSHVMKIEICDIYIDIKTCNSAPRRQVITFL